MALRRVHVAYGSASSPISPVEGRPAVPKLRKGWPEIKSARIFSCHNFWIWKTGRHVPEHPLKVERIQGGIWWIRLYHSLWLFRLHSAVKYGFFPVFPLAEPTAKAFYWLFLWSFKEITNKLPQSQSPPAEKMDKKHIFSVYCWNKTTLYYNRAK